jgi:hypothetical protein
MKSEQGIFNSCIIVTCVVLFGLSLLTTGNSLEVSYLVGDVKFQRSAKIMPLTMETKLVAGDIVSTGKKSFCTLKYNDGSVVEIRSESKIAVGNENVKGSDYVSLISGTVHGKFVKMQKGGSGSKVYTPTAVCAIRGTEFTIASGGAGDSRVKLEEGMLQVRNPFGKVDIAEGENSEIGIAEKPVADRSEEDIASWNNRKKESFECAPEEAANRYGAYMEKLDGNSKSSSKKISELDKNLTRNTMKGKQALEKSNDELAKVDEDLQDEMFLSNNARLSIDGVIESVGQSKESIRSKFLQVKEECNKVAEQQRRNYEALQAVKEAYRKAYESIVKTHRDTIKSIKGQ